jgi:SAM-dependent methyltransferase
VSASAALESALVCPDCKNPLRFSAAEAICTSCGRRFSHSEGVWDLIVGQRFPDNEDPSLWEVEEAQDRHRAANYYIPLFRSFKSALPNRPLRLLSVGCGVAAEVDQLVDEGFECFGIDCGNRSATWSRRSHRENLVLANGMYLPFEDQYFDVLFAGCVFPHVGTNGDSYEVSGDFWSQRQQLSREMARVSRPGANLVISCPNRLFPFDLFHRGGKGYLPRFNFPKDPFLLSLNDFRRLFIHGCGCSAVSALPPGHYWGFNRLTKSRTGRLASRVIAGYLDWLSRDGMNALRASFAAPWLVVKVTK